MLNGKLGIERADNGWILSWYERRKSNAEPMDASREVFTDAQECIARIADLLGMHSDSAARAFFSVAEAQHNPAVDPDVVQLIPLGAPESAYAGD